VLDPKTVCPQKISEYRPINLIHSFTKIISKLMPNRLSPELQHIIANNQTTFIKKRNIHDSFMFVQQMVRRLHKKKTSALFVKLDISKAFDTVNWPYLLGIMTHMGFGVKWKNWIASLWNTASSPVILNGDLGKRILHCRGVRQRDPLSPMLFLLAIEPLHLLFRKAQEQGILKKLVSECDALRVSLYTDNATLFINPSEAELQVTNSILQIFAEASGLKTNLTKTQCYPIHCQGSVLSFISTLGYRLAEFPCSYLGLL
jgi:hypothetical protein